MQHFVKSLHISALPSVCTFLLVIALTSMFCACTRDQVADKRTLVVALGSEPSTLDPRFATDANGVRIVSLLFNSLVRIGPDLKVEGDASQSWTYDSKKRTYLFKLFPNMRFSNQRELKREDLLFTFEEYRSAKNPYKSALDAVKSVKVEGENSTGFQVKLQMAYYSAKFLSSDLPIVKILPKKEIQQTPNLFNEKPIGTGYFSLQSKSANQIVLKAQSPHAISTPNVEFLVFKIIRDEFTRFQKTLKGSIDIAQAEISPSKVVEFEKRPSEFNVYKYPGLSMTYIVVNLKDPALSKYDLRKALAESIHRDEIIKYKLEGLATRATSILTPSNPYFNPNLKDIDYSPESASQSIERLGLKGKTLILKTSNSQSAVDNARVLAYQISKSGLNIKLQSYEWGTFYGDIKAGNFQLATMRWVGTLDPDIYRLAFHSREVPPGRNRGHYINPVLDQLVDEGLKISDEKKRIEHYYEVQEIVQNDLAIIPLWYDRQVAIVHKRVKGYSPWQTSDFYPFIFVSKE